MGKINKTLYLNDSYLKEWGAIVESVKEGKYVILDKTAFYPNSGGQPHDMGSIVKDREFKVIYVGKFEGKISHEVDGKGLKEGDIVECRVDWARRHKLMRMHTAAHILSEMVHKKTGSLITGNQLNLDKSRIDFSLEDFNRELIVQCIEESNKIVDQNLLIKVYYLPREKALEIGNISKLAKGLPESIKEIRIVEIQDFDVQADGGTHVKSTKEVGYLRFLDAENKGKSNRRVYFGLVD